MKTTYQKPETTIVDVEIQNLMMVSNGTDGTVNSVTTASEDYNGGTVLGRGGSAWDDDEY